ncbi:DUF466 domain-containing protein [Micromonospora endolithica]|uniref:DUF466 domain-containing protein n=1 Tax=Micromonospora endolithica TaxID=230091 RepID=A0A3A9ZDY9_9ACTN|nr:DUF466 domain-containing protein [Micromonospora endolithica]
MRWYLREISGENAYATYLAHHRQSHPTGPALTRRQFEERRNAPSVRCC